MKLIQVNSRGLACVAVDSGSHPDFILHGQHTGLFEVLAQTADVKADHTIMNINIGAVVQIGKGTRHILFPQTLVQVAQNRHILRDGVFQIFPVHLGNTAVNDRLLDGLQAALGR